MTAATSRHDSIGLGEDGPTHQPIEHYPALRAIPGLDFVRPADANETAVAWRTILEHNDRPAGRSLFRQNLPVFDRTQFASAEGVARGGYVLTEASGGAPEVILMGTGSEVQIAVAARRRWRLATSQPESCRCRAGSGSQPRTGATASRCCRPRCAPG